MDKELVSRTTELRDAYALLLSMTPLALNWLRGGKSTLMEQLDFWTAQQYSSIPLLETLDSGDVIMHDEILKTLVRLDNILASLEP